MSSLFFCQNDALMGGSIWQKNSLVTLILFDLCLFEHFSPVANFAQQSIEYWKLRLWKWSNWQERLAKSLTLIILINYHILDLSVMNDIMAIVEGRFDKKVSLDRIWSLNNFQVIQFFQSHSNFKEMYFTCFCTLHPAHVKYM